MKPITFFKSLLSYTLLFIISCNNNTESTTTANDTTKSADKKIESVTPDFRNYPQYVSCKIDGQPYLAYYSDNQITGISNSLNMASRQDFSTSAEQETINGKTKISELTFSFYSLSKKGEGTLTSLTDFYVQGHTDFPEGGDLKYVSFKTGADQQLTLTSSKDGMLEGSFTFDVIAEKDPSHILKVTDGFFKLKQEGKTKLKVNKDGDVNMDSLLKSIK